MWLGTLGEEEETVLSLVLLGWEVEEREREQEGSSFSEERQGSLEVWEVSV